MKFTFLRLPALLTAALALGGCGGLTLKTFPITDQADVPLLAEMAGQNKVVYATQNGFTKGKLPSVLSLVLRGQASAPNSLGDVSGLIYVRTRAVTLADSHCSMTDSVWVCDAAGETEFLVEQIDVPYGQQVPFSLQGGKLQTAAVQGLGYFGISAEQLNVLPASILRLTDVKADVRL